MTVACDALTATYDEVWSRGREALVADRPSPDPLPVEGGIRWGISAVFRLRSWSPMLVDCATRLQALIGPNHFVYGPQSLHITLQQFEPYRARVAVDDGRVRVYRDDLAAVAARRTSVRIRLRGLSASPAGVIVQGFPLTDLQALRVDLYRQRVASGLPLRGPEADRATLRTTAHASLAVYGGRVEPPAELIAFIDERRETDFGEQVFERLDLVGYHRTACTVALVPYGGSAIGDRPA